MDRVLGAAIIGASLWAAPLHAADIAIDVESGAILTASDADAPRLPASLTKLMTAYVAFDAIARGTIDADASVTVSRFAARTPPVKLGLRVGAKVNLSEILGAAVIGSKNDAAVLVAEAIAVSEAVFVDRMNDAAQKLGMTNTRFANATGLPAPGQRTTARDIALLSRALLTEFPKRSRLFSQRSTKAVGKRVGTTNPLFGRVKGAEGLKTGFTCAAGYSISALIERGEQRIIAVTLGHQTKGARLRSVRGLIDAAFTLSGQAPESSEVLTSALPTSLSPPDIGACGGSPAPVVASDISPEEMALYAAELAKAKRRVWQSAKPQAVVAPVKPQVTLPVPLSGWAVFLGAHPTEQGALAQIRKVRLRIGMRGNPWLEHRSRDGRKLALVHGLDRQIASALCKGSKQFCLVLSPARLLNRKAQWRR